VPRSATQDGLRRHLPFNLLRRYDNRKAPHTPGTSETATQTFRCVAQDEIAVPQERNYVLDGIVEVAHRIEAT
jgi:hypothetical protein